MTFFDFPMLIAQNSGFNTEQFDSSPPSAAAGGVILFLILIYIALVVLVVAGQWKMFTKAGKPGWACLVPIYNIIVWVEMAGRPIWWFLLLFVPLVNFVISIILLIDITNKFGRGGGTIVGLLFLPFVFIPILGFGSAQYNADA